MRLAALVAVLVLSFPATAASAPSPVTAWSVYGSSPAALASYAYARGCDFARSQPGGGLRILLLDFGAARKLNAGTWGTNDLRGAADGYHNCHVRGSVDIVYGNSNYHLSGSGMSSRCRCRSLRRFCGCGTDGSSATAGPSSRFTPAQMGMTLPLAAS